MKAFENRFTPLQIAIPTFYTATHLAVNNIKEICVTVEEHDEMKQKDLLEKPYVMAHPMLTLQWEAIFNKMVVDALMRLNGLM